MTFENDTVATDGAIGFSITGGSLLIALVKPQGLAPTDKTGYMGLEIGLDGASLVGVDGLTFIASGSVLINKATDAAGLASTERIDWFSSTSQTNDPGNLIPDFSDKLNKNLELQIAGSASLDVFGFVVGTATFEMTQATATVTDGTTTVTDASLMAISLNNVNLFAGIGASLNDNGTLTAGRRQHQPWRGHRPLPSAAAVSIWPLSRIRTVPRRLPPTTSATWAWISPWPGRSWWVSTD